MEPRLHILKIQAFFQSLGTHVALGALLWLTLKPSLVTLQNSGHSQSLWASFETSDETSETSIPNESSAPSTGLSTKSNTPSKAAVKKQSPLSSPTQPPHPTQNKATSSVQDQHTTSQASALSQNQDQRTGSQSASSGLASSAELTEYLMGVRKQIHEKVEYPSLLRRRGITGEVQVRVVLEQNGNLKNVEIQKSSGTTELDDLALKAVRSAAPFPTMEKNEAEPTGLLSFNLPIDFRLIR